GRRADRRAAPRRGRRGGRAHPPRAGSGDHQDRVWLADALRRQARPGARVPGGVHVRRDHPRAYRGRVGWQNRGLGCACFAPSNAYIAGKSDRSLMNYVDAAYAPLRKTGQIKRYGPEAFAGMRKAGQLVAECLDLLADEVKPGIATDHIDRFVFEFAMNHGALPATLMYRGYNKATCTSINHVVCHGIPNDKPLREGDILNIDVTLILDGWHGDSSRMYPVGEVPRRAERLIEVTYEAMMRGIAAVRPGGTTGDIGAAIQSYVEPQHMSVVRDFCGHGLGRLFHDEPNIVHVGRPGDGIELKPGMFFT